jgi:proline-specific peptidase
MPLTRRGVLAGFAGVALAPGLRAGDLQPLPQPDPALWHIDDEPTITGQAPGPNGGVYYRLYGQAGRTPVITLHGGPAAGETYMRPYVGLAADRQVVTYDQSGCGKSARPADMSLYTLDRYVEELEALRRHLAFDQVILIGHSWGGFLAPAYAARYPKYVAGLVLAGTAVRWSDFQLAADRWLVELGPDARPIIDRAEKGGSLDDPDYGKLVQAYYARHLCRLDPYPDWFVQAAEEINRNPVYAYLNGPTEFQFSGAFASLDNNAVLKTLRTPTLITCGEYDEGPPWVAERLKKAVRRSKLAVFPQLSHMAHIEDPALVIGTTGAFLNAAKL